MNRRTLPFAIGAALLAVPVSAEANAGTPLMWAGMFHLAIGNLLIGILEGWLLAGFFSPARGKAIATMIGANYLSAWLGGFFLRGALMAYLPLDLNNGWFWFWVMVPVTFLMTAVIEWPFVFSLFRGEPRAWKRSAIASLVVQSVSYLLLFGWYWMAGNTSLYTRARVVAADELALPKNLTVYYLSLTDGAVYSRSLTSGAVTRLVDLPSQDRDNRLLVRRSEVESNRWDVLARLETDDRNAPRFVPVATNLAGRVALEWNVKVGNQTSGTWMNWGQVPVVDGVTNRPIRYWAGFWEGSGLRVTDARTGKWEHFAFETPFGAWWMRNAVQLPDDQLIFQLGRDQICAFDPRTKSFALLFRGRGPVPVIGGSSEAKPAF